MNYSISNMRIRFICVVISFFSVVRAEDARFMDMPDESGFFSDLEMADFFDSDISSGFSITRANPTDILNALNAVNAIALLEFPFYERSNPTHRRDIIDYPFFYPHCSFYDDDVVTGLTLFFNKTNKVKYFKNHTEIAKYLAINNPDFIDALEDTVANVKLLFQDAAFNLDVKRLFGLFSNAFVDERRLGGMFYLNRQWKRFSLFCMIPFYYRERNFDLTEADKIEIRKDFGQEDPDFINDHLIADKIGLGDTRLELSGFLYRTKTSYCELGFQLTVPTAWSIKKGLRGSFFPKKASQPTFDLKKIFDLADDGVQPGESSEAFGIVTSFVLQSLDHLSANILDVPLGNDGHFGVGFVARTSMPLSTFFKYEWASHISWQWRGSFEYLAGKEVKRMFIKFPDITEFQKRNFATTDEVLAYEYVTFLEQQLSDQFFPPFLETMVQPGFIIRSMNSFSSMRSWFGWTIGSDFWLQTKESFAINNIDASSSTLNLLRVATAKQSYGYQWKLFGSLSARWKRAKQDLVFSLDIDSTLSDYGIGKDWSVGLSIESHF